ncbi:hypothetical protein A9P82_11685 [Arachidicoccus ginsenosidimutans]|uniref:ABC transporter permease n=1 Tax=Arachidicoccus sp. BS20 TaxID=1850526 RepID=UPI0007F084E8|nr:ABC transporter permease [Arachidicoccus sp. BS20]ANI89889.1 hypothetical protein A9P82_11685 [Arachidicoccus sp. BS20]
MFLHYFKTASKILKKNKIFTVLNIGGLAIGIACVALILLWVENQLDYNKQFNNAANIYQVMDNQKYNGNYITFDASPHPLVAALKQSVPEIKNAVSVDWTHSSAFSLGNKKIAEQGTEADSTFFQIFNFPVVEGSLKNALNDNNGIVISQKMAMAFFGNKPAVGKTLKMNGNKLFTVKAVIKDMPKNMTFNYDYIIKMDVHGDYAYQENWGSNSLEIFVELYPNANVDAINKKIQFTAKANGSDNSAEFWLFPLSKTHLYHDFANGKPTGSGQIKYVKMFSFVGFIILLIACINFMNLSTARAQNRSKEVGVRKVFGARRQTLMKQFLTEALMVSFIAMFIAVGLVYVTLPLFNSVFKTEIAFHINTTAHIVGLLLITIVCGVLAGSYPALYLSSFNPIKALRRQSSKTSSGGGFVRKALVVVQFSASIILIISTIIIYQQIQHTKIRDLGFDKEHLIYLPQPGDNISQHFEAFRNELLQTGLVEDASMSWSSPLQIGSGSSDYHWDGQAANEKILISLNRITPHYITTAGFHLMEGRDFQSPATDSANIIINESFAKLIGEKNGRVGGVIYDGGGNKINIIGVLKNFVYNNMSSVQPDPMFFYCVSPADNYMELFIRLKANTDVASDIAKIKSLYDKEEPENPFNYKFVDKEFETFFQSEEMLGNLAFVFGGLAIIISCLGLFGLSAFMAEQRTKEIGIRKVLGASVKSIVQLLSKDFLKLVALSCIIAFPAAYLLMRSWLQNYQYRIGVEWYVFIIAAALALLIAFITVSSQAFKAARANPVKSLKTE